MGKMFQFEFKQDIDKGMKDYFNKVGISKGVPKEADLKGREAAGKYLLDSIVNGSNENPIKPPELTGALKASGSAHVSTQPAFYTTDFLPVQSPEVATPNTASIRGTRDQITIGFNRAYAARWEVNDFDPGEISLMNGPVSSHWLSSHIMSDSRAAFFIYTNRLRVLSGG